MTLFLLNIAVLVVFAYAYVPQLKETFQTKTADGVSLFFWLLVSWSTSYTLFNLLATGNAAWYVYLGQFINAGVAFLLFVWILKLRASWVQTVVIAVIYVIVNLIIFNSFPIEITQNIGTIAIILAYVDQIVHFIRTKSSEGTSPSLYFLFALGLACLLAIVIITNASILVVITEVSNIILLLVCGTLSLKYRK